MWQGIAFVLSAAVLFQETPNKNKDLHVDKANGYSIQKPPKNEAWDIKTGEKKLQSSLVSVAHRIDDLAVEVWFQKQDKVNPLDLSPKETAKGELKGLEEMKTKGDYKEVKVKELPREVKFPGDGKPNAHYFRAIIKDRNDRELEWAEWIFVSKANQGQYRVWVIGAPGEYDKKKKEVEMVLASFRSFKLPK